MIQTNANNLTFPQRVLAAQERFRSYTGALNKLRTQHPGLAQGGYASGEYSFSQIGRTAVLLQSSVLVRAIEGYTDAGLTLMNFRKLDSFTEEIFQVAEDFCVQDKNRIEQLKAQASEIDDCHKKYKRSAKEEEKVSLYNQAVIAANGMRETLLSAIEEYMRPRRMEIITEIFGTKVSVDGVLSALRKLSIVGDKDETRKELIEDIEKYLKSELPPLLDRSIHWLLSMVGKRGFDTEAALVGHYNDSLARRQLREKVAEEIRQEIPRAILSIRSDEIVSVPEPSICLEGSALVCKSISSEQVEKIKVLNAVLAEGEAAEGDISFFNLPNMQTIDQLKAAIGEFLKKGYIHLLFAIENKEFADALDKVPRAIEERRKIESELFGETE